MQNYYVVLGVSKGANLDKIKKAYRRIAKKHHPDVAQSRESKKKFLEIREAYETLSDEKKRKEHDKELERQKSPVKYGKSPERLNSRKSYMNKVESLFSTSADDFFEGFVPGFFDRDNRRFRGKDLYYEAVISPEEAAEGGLYPVTIPVWEPCPNCSRTGFFGGFFCPVCNGYGRVQSKRTFSLSIPPNVSNGTEIELSLEDIGLRDVFLNVVVYIDQRINSFL